MAKGLNEDITNITTSWSGYSGLSVENFIKGELNKLNNSKIGYIGKDGDKYKFASTEEEFRNGNYIGDEITTYKAYTIDIKLEEGGNFFLPDNSEKKLTWWFKTVDANNHIIDEDISVEYIITKNGSTKKYPLFTIQNSEKDKDGYTKVVVDLDDYISDGNATFTININGLFSKEKATARKPITILGLKSSDFSNNNTIFTDNIKFNAKISCTQGKTYYCYYRIYDIEQHNENPEFIPYGDGYGFISEDSGSRNKEFSVNIEDLEKGFYILEYKLGIYPYQDGEGMYFTDVQSFEFYKGEASTDILTASNILLYSKYNPTLNENNIYENSMLINGIKQYISYTLPFSYIGPENIIATFYIVKNETEEEILTSFNVENKKIYNYLITLDAKGITKIKVKFSDKDTEEFKGEKIFYFNVLESDFNIREYKTDIITEFNSKGKNNFSDDKNIWLSNDGKYSAVTNSDFIWTQGWTNNGLVISKGCELNFNFTPFPSGNNYGKNGCSFEIEFMTQNVTNDDVVLCNMMSESKSNFVGFQITGTEFIFNSIIENTKVSTRFKPNEMNRIAVVIRPNTNNKGEFKGLIELYVNGIICGVAKYDADDNFIIDKDAGDSFIDRPLQFKSEGNGEIVLKHIRFYNTCLSSDDVVNNYIINRNTSSEMLSLYNKNNIFMVENGVKYFTPESAIEMGNIPVLVFFGRTIENELATGDSNADVNGTYVSGSTDANENYHYKKIEGTTDKKYKVDMDVVYHDPRDTSKNFKFVKAYITPQGTSSMYYPKKNFRIYTQKNNDTRMFLSSKEYGDLTFDIMKRSNFGEEASDRNYEVFRGQKKQRLYSFKDGAQPVKCWCLKADFAETSSSHNTGIARLWNNTLKNSKVILDNTNTEYPVFKTMAQSLSEKNGFKYDVRTTIDGFPILVFAKENYSDDSDYVFLGKYNFNNDKSTESVFGFCDIDNKAKFPYESYDYDNEKEENVEKTLDDQLNQYMTCVETLDNGNNLANFIFDSIEDFNEIKKDSEEKEKKAWELAFEFRYPEVPEKPKESDYKENGVWKDGGQAEYNEAVAEYEKDLTKWENTHLKPFKHFAEWINSTRWCDVNGNILPGLTTAEAEARKNKFATEKWDHLDVWKVAAYYIYLMRFGAVDQVVKNSMLTSEGPFAFDKQGQQYGVWDATDITSDNYGKYYKWYYINYDNDTIMGVKNDGSLVYGPDINRQSVEGNKKPIYAGHESVLWNNLEQDVEFNNIVKIADKALASTMSYNNAIKEFDVNQVGQWCERIYNRDAQYKYLNPYIDDWKYGEGDENVSESDKEAAKENNFADKLFMLQGSRTAHRRWWLSKRFDYFNSKWNSGDFKERFIEVKCDYGVVGDEFGGIAGTKSFYGYEINNNSFGDKEGGNNTEYNVGDTIKWVLKKNIQIGDPIGIYGAVNLSKLDLGGLSKYLTSLAFYMGNNSDLGNQLEVLDLNIPEDLLKTTYSYITYSDVYNDKGVIVTKAFDLFKQDTGIDESYFENENWTRDEEISVMDTPESEAPQYYRLKITDDKGNFVTYIYYNKITGGVRNYSCKELTLSSLDKLKEIKVAGFMALNSLSLTENPSIEVVDTRYSNVSKITFSKDDRGSNIECLNASSALNNLTFKNCGNIKTEKIFIDGKPLTEINGNNILTINVDSSRGLSEDKNFKDFIVRWIDNGVDNKEKTLNLNNIKWTDVSIKDINTLYSFAKGENQKPKECTISGVLYMKNEKIEEEDIKLFNDFEDYFNGKIKIKINTPNVILKSINNEVVAGKSAEYTYTLYPNDNNAPIVAKFVTIGSRDDHNIQDTRNDKYYKIIENEDVNGIREGLELSLSEDNKKVYVKSIEKIEGTDTTALVALLMKYNASNWNYFDVKEVYIKDPTYAKSGIINGPLNIDESDKTYTYNISLFTANEETPNGTIEIEWLLSGEDGYDEYIEYHNPSEDNMSYIIKRNNTLLSIDKPLCKIKLTAKIRNINNYNNIENFEIIKDIAIISDDVVVTKISNPDVMKMCKKWASSEDVLTKKDIEDVTEIDSDTFSGQIHGEGWSFEEFKHFKNVTKIKKGAFKNSNITSIVIPENVKILENSTEKIGDKTIITEDGIFENCTNLRNVYFGDTYNTLSSNITIIPIKCFYGCNKLESIVIPDSVEEISTLAFGKTSFNKIKEKTDNITYNDKNIIYISKNTSLNTIKNGAFEEDEKWEPSKGKPSTSKLEEITIPNNLGITNSACNFLFSDNLRKINLIDVDKEGYKLLLENNILYNTIGDTKFSILKCLKVDNEEDIIDELNAESITEVIDYAFYNSNVVKSVKFSSSLGSIGYGTFYNSSIEHIDLSTSTIGVLPDYSFYDLKNVKSILLPKDTEFDSFGSNLFYNCINLTELVIPNCKNLYTINSATTNTNTFVNCGIEKLEFPENFASGQSFTNFIVGCQNLKEVILPAYVKITNNVNVIVNCENLTKITLPIFSYTNSEEENIVINDNVKWEVGVSNNLFISNCKNLTEFIGNDKDNNRKFIIYNGAIYEKVDENSNELSIAVVPYKSVSDASIYVNDVTINNEKYEVVKIRDYSFNSTDIKTLKNIKSVKQIGTRAFNNCFLLEEVVIPDNINDIPLYAFDGCVNLSKLTIGTNVKTIGANAFKDCKNLYEIKILCADLVTGLTCNYQDFNADTDILSYDSHPFTNVGTNIEGEKNIYVPYNSIDSFKFKVWSIGIYDSNDKFNEEDVYENLTGIYIDNRYVSSLNFFLSEDDCKNFYETNKEKFDKNKFYQIIETDGYWLTPLLNEKAYNFKISELSLNNEVTLKLINENGESYNNGTITLVSDKDNLRFTATNEPRTSTFNNDINGYNIDLNNNVSQGEEISIFDDDGNYIGSFIAEYGVNTYEVQIENIEHNASTYSLRNNSNTEEMANITKKEYEALLSRVNQMAEIIGKLKK